MATVAPFPSPEEDGSRSEAEAAVLAGLRRIAERQRIGWIANGPFMPGVARRAYEVDIIVCVRGRCFGIEVDGPHHAKRGRYVADRSRDMLLEDAGLLFVRRIAVEDTRDPAVVDLFLDGCLSRIAWAA